MSTPKHFKGQVEDWWNHVADGWHHFIERTGKALTKFTPSTEEHKSGLAHPQSVRWGLLPAEVKEKKKEVVVTVEAPGLDKENIDLEINEGFLIVTGEKHNESTSEEGRWHIHERTYGSFQRAIPLPVDVLHNDSKASYRNGVLTVHLPKVNEEDRTPKRVKIS